MIQARVKRLVRSVRRIFDPRVVILHYHRVTELPSDPHGLCVTPARFAEHMAVVRRIGRPTALRQLVEELRDGTIQQRTVVVTFDDGYADNLHQAKPLLERHGVPATVFVTSDAVGATREFWWDELDQLLLQQAVLPPTLELTVNGQNHCLQTHSTALREAALRNAAGVLRGLGSAQKRRCLDALFASARVKPVLRHTHQTLSRQDLVQLASEGLVEIGAHTATHPSLPVLPLSEQEREIRQSKSSLEEILGKPVTSFAYPHGHRTAETAVAVKAAGFDCACACDDQFVNAHSDRFQLPRILVGDWDGEETERRLTKWLGN